MRKVALLSLLLLLPAFAQYVTWNDLPKYSAALTFVQGALTFLGLSLTTGSFGVLVLGLVLAALGALVTYFVATLAVRLIR